MSLDLWAKVLTAVRILGEQTEAETGTPDTSAIIWHGGEPTLLPRDYMEAVLALQRSILPESWFATGRIRNRIQTNLFSISDATLDFLRQHEIGIGVSFDVVEGARLDMRGRPTEARVRKNIDRLRAHGIIPALNVVIAGHNAGDAEGVYAHLRDYGRPCALLPLFNGPAERPVDGIEVDRETINGALFRIFRLWFEDGCSFRIRPLDEYLTMVVMKMLGLRRPVYDRRRTGDRIIVVELDGRLYEPCVSYGPESAFGNLNTQTMGQILRSPAYERGLERNDAVRDNTCRQCDYFGACGSSQMFMADDGGAEQARCMTARPLCHAIEAYLRQSGIGPEQVTGVFRDLIRPAPSPAAVGRVADTLAAPMGGGGLAP